VSLSRSHNLNEHLYANKLILSLWEVATGRELFRFRAKSTYGHSLALSPDGRVLAVEGPKGSILLWDLCRGKELRPLRGHMHEVQSLAFSPDGRLLASGSADGTVLLWDTAAILKGSPRLEKKLSPQELRALGNRGRF
jgi:WD40 repeat protein